MMEYRGNSSKDSENFSSSAVSKWKMFNNSIQISQTYSASELDALANNSLASSERHALLRRAFSNSDLLSHPVDERQDFETHISSIYLAGEFAYKIKKPVDLGFLDFSSIELRKHYCFEELRLNRRLSPSLYIAVVKLFVKNGSLHMASVDADDGKSENVAEQGEVIEYAVKMRRFPQEALLSALASMGDLDGESLTGLAEALATFHVNCPTLDPTLRKLTLESASEEDLALGAPTTIHKAFTANFDTILPLVTSPLDRGRLDMLKRWGDLQFDKLKDVFQQRVEGGFVRECHGDLHLNNIVKFEGTFKCFDCIEFNEAFRWIDVMSEVAFLYMDIKKHGLHHEAVSLLNTYLSHTGDYAGLQVLNYYVVYRALVRAKVALLSQHSIDNDSNKVHCMKADQQQKLYQEFSSYLELATRFVAPVQGKLIIAHGLSGSGKSFWSKRLAPFVNAIHLRSDIERKRLYGYRPDADTDSLMSGNIYSEQASRLTYERLKLLAKTVLRSGYNVLVDATFLKSAVRDKFAHLAEKLDIEFFIFAYQAPHDLMQERIIKRLECGDDPSEANLDVLRMQSANLEPLSPTELVSTLLIDTSEGFNPVEMQKRVQRFVAKRKHHAA